MTKTRPIQIIRQKNKVIVERTSDGEVLAHCFIGDDDNVERIADILSAMRLTQEANQLRQMLSSSRKRVHA